MIRFLAALVLIFPFYLPLVSCTSPSGDDELSADSPIDDGGVGAAAEDVEKGSANASEEDSLDKELAQPEEGAAPPANETAQAAPKGGSDDLESEFEKEGGQNVEGADNLKNDVAANDLESDQTPAPEAAPIESAPVPAEPPPAAEAATPPPAEPPPPAPVEEKVRVSDIRYQSNSSGGTVIIETTKPVTYQTRLNPATQQFVIEMAGVELPGSLQRPYQTKDSNSRIGGINAYQAAGSDTARIVIQLAGKLDGEPVVQQEGASLVVIPPAPAPVAERPPEAAPVAARASGGEGALAAHTLDEFLTGNQKFYGRLISLQVKDADVRDVVNFIAEESGANIVMSDDVKGHISIKVRRVPWDQALVTVMRSKDLGYVRQGNVLMISTLKALQLATESTNKIIEGQKAIVPAVVQVIPVNYANMAEMVKNLKPFLSKEGTIVADERTNTLVTTDKGDVVDRIQKLVKSLDIPPAQVSIESKIVEATEEFNSFAGINWNFSGSQVPISQAGGANGTPINMSLAGSSSSLSNGFTGGTPFSTTLNIGTLDLFGSLSATLSLAEADSLAKVITSPRISAMNREKAQIVQKGENVSVITTRSEVTNTVTKQEKRTPFSLELDVTPQITTDGSIIMDLEVKREFLGPVLDAETQARAVNSRSAKTKILVRNGQTAVIGGIYASDETEATNGVPGLMQIPVLGWLFKNKSVTREKNELLIFLTPRILAQEEIKLSDAVTHQ